MLVLIHVSFNAFIKTLNDMNRVMTNQHNGFATSMDPDQKHTDVCLRVVNILFEPRHDKTNIMVLRPAWIQTSLRIRAV
jgi:hypothetical protein